MKLDLKHIRTSKNIPAKEIVEVVKSLYPSYDKTLQSKCENGDAYGVCLLPDAAKAVLRSFAPELQKKKDGHRLTCRISCRLEKPEYESLMKNIKAEGFVTTQDWLSDMVRRYNAKMKNNNLEPKGERRKK